MISDVVAQISALVTDELAAVNIGQLVDGEIKVGARYTDNVGAPRIWFVPADFGFGPRAASAPTTASERQASGRNTVTIREALTQRPLFTKSTTFEVHVVAPATSADTIEDFRFAEYLADLVVWAAHSAALGSAMPSRGQWNPEQGVDQQAPQTHHIVFGLELSCPVTDKPTRPALLFVTPGTTQQAEVSYDNDTTTETA